MAMMKVTTTTHKWPNLVARASEALKMPEKQLRPMQHAHSHIEVAKQVSNPAILEENELINGINNSDQYQTATVHER